MAMLDEAPSLSGKVARGKRMTKTRKLVAGVPLRLAHAGSSTALKSDPGGRRDHRRSRRADGQREGPGRSGRPDRCPRRYLRRLRSRHGVDAVARPEGHQRDEASGLEFWSVQDAEDIDSTIWKFWQQGTRYHWTWRCPHCRERFVPRFSCLQWEGQDNDNATPAQARATAVAGLPAQWLRDRRRRQGGR
jgi:hypothetical protein